MKPITLELVNKSVVVKDIRFKNEIFLKKLKNIGLYKNQIIKIKKIGNYKNIIGIEINNIVSVLRIDDAKQIIVKEV